MQSTIKHFEFNIADVIVSEPAPMQPAAKYADALKLENELLEAKCNLTNNQPSTSIHTIKMTKEIYVVRHTAYIHEPKRKP